MPHAISMNEETAQVGHASVKTHLTGSRLRLTYAGRAAHQVVRLP